MAPGNILQCVPVQPNRAHEVAYQAPLWARATTGKHKFQLAGARRPRPLKLHVAASIVPTPCRSRRHDGGAVEWPREGDRK
jgi:hypothetical protein